MSLRRGSKSLDLDRLPVRRSLVRIAVLNVAHLLHHEARRHPRVALVLLALTLALVVFGLRAVALVLLGVSGLFVLLLAAWPRARWMARVSIRAAWVYRRRWAEACAATGLDYRTDAGTWLPRLKKVVSSPWRERILVELVPGQEPEDFEAKAGALAHYFRARHCRVHVDRPGRIWVDFAIADPLSKALSALPMAPTSDLAALSIGLREDGDPWTVGLRGRHTLIAGASGSGKGSVLWSLVRAMAPGVGEGSVNVWAVDPKGGMELDIGRPLWARYAFDDTESMVCLLEDAVTVMKERSEDLRCTGMRAHVPTPDSPLIVVLVDELADLIAYGGTREDRKRAVAALQLLLTQGRAPGVAVVAAVQDPSKEIVPFRDLFTVRIALRLMERTQVSMVLGATARDRGALCDEIPHDMPGTGFVIVEGVREPVRVRAAYVSDDDIRAMSKDRMATTERGTTSLPAPDNQPSHGVRGRVKGGPKVHHEVTRSALDAAPSPPDSPIGGREPHHHRQPNQEAS